MSDEKDHVIWYTDNYVGDCILWWGPDECGYTTDLDKAGRYTEEHAKRIEKRRGKEKAVPFKIAEAVCTRHVLAGRLRVALIKVESH